MKFGCHLPTYGPHATREHVLAFARQMEELGYDSLWVRDHVALPWTSRRRYPYSRISPTGAYPVAPDAPLLDVREIACFPQPVARRIPIWIGGDSPRALRRAAELGDGWHPAFASPAQIEAGLEVLRAECLGVGRRPEDITVTLRAVISFNDNRPEPRPPLEGKPDQIAADLERYADLGVRGVVLQTPADDIAQMRETYERVAREIWPRLSTVGRLSR